MIETPKGDPNAIAVTGDGVYCMSQPDAMEESRSIDANADSSADFFVLRRLFVDVDQDTVIITVLVEGRRGEDASDAAANYGDCERSSFSDWHDDLESVQGMNRRQDYPLCCYGDTIICI